MTINTCSLLKKKSKKIMILWQKRAEKELFQKNHETSLVLQDSLPEYLHQMAMALSPNLGRSKMRKRNDTLNSHRIGKKHADERSQFTEYSIDQLIFEFHILRQTIFQVLEKETEISREARDIILNSIENLVNVAATEFSESARNLQEHLSVTITHDLRSPMNTAKMAAEIIVQQKDKPETIKKLAYQIIDNMGRIDHMVQDLLDFSRLRSGKRLDYPLKPFDLNELTAEACNDLNILYENRVRVISESAVTGHWNKQSLWRVLENLVANAIKYGAQDKEVTIKLEKNKTKAILSVHNFGKIIPQNQKAAFLKNTTGKKSILRWAGELDLVL